MLFALKIIAPYFFNCAIRGFRPNKISHFLSLFGTVEYANYEHYIIIILSLERKWDITHFYNFIVTCFIALVWWCICWHYIEREVQEKTTFLGSTEKNRQYIHQTTYQINYYMLCLSPIWDKNIVHKWGYFYSREISSHMFPDFVLDFFYPMKGKSLWE